MWVFPMTYSQTSYTPKIEPDSSLVIRLKQENNSHLLKEEGKHVSLQEYWDHYYEHEDFAYEWNNGILENKPMTDQVSLKLYYWFLDLLQEYLHAHPIAQLTGLELGVKMKTSVRKPDIGVVLDTNPILFQSGDHSYKGVFDLCIESLSIPNAAGIKRDTVTKKREYEKSGISEYYILDHRHQKTLFYRLNPKTKKYKRIPLEEGNIIRSEVLPGFCFRVTDLKMMRDLNSLADDPVYSSYVLLKYQKENPRADQEQQKKEKEKLRADQEQKEKEKSVKEKLIRFLRSQGFNPEDVL